jgi:hypothetical protein
MTDTQLYLAIGVPVISNIVLFTLFTSLILRHMDKRFDDARDLWRAELRRVEEVLDARLKHLEER